ncbi:MAG: FMN-binding protein [Oscillospiraceae bacterium]|nr:FMN-binding protein [Oscillospiraceae bacterium]
MKKILKLTVVLFLICAIVAAVLGEVNAVTIGPITVRQREKTEKAYKAVLPYADSFTELDPASYAAYKTTINKISVADNGAGYVVETTFSGAQGYITMAVGVDGDGKCAGISIIKHSETSGLGEVAASSSERGVSFRKSFIGKDETITIQDIDAITGATITSKAVTGAVATAIEAVKALG